MTQKWWQSILLSLISAFVALSTHYGLGIAIGYFDELGDNIVWYIKAIPLGIILGLIGYFSQLNNSVGNILKMIIPAFLIIEPFYLGRFTTYWYNRPVVNLANKIAAWLELSIGILTVILFLFVFRKEKMQNQMYRKFQFVRLAKSNLFYPKARMPNFQRLTAFAPMPLICTHGY